MSQPPSIETLAPTDMWGPKFTGRAHLHARNADKAFVFFRYSQWPHLWSLHSDGQWVYEDDVIVTESTSTRAWQDEVKVDVVAQNEYGETIGDPVSFWLRPPNDPSKPLPFLIKSVTWEWDELTLYFRCTTPQSVYLHALVGPKPPWKKRGAHYKRGTVYKHSPVVHFEYKWQQFQEQSGDTTNHTFIFLFEEHGQTLYWKLRGEIDGKPAASASPFFSATAFHPDQYLKDLGIYDSDDVFWGDVRLTAGSGITLQTTGNRTRVQIGKA